MGLLDQVLQVLRIAKDVGEAADTASDIHQAYTSTKAFEDACLAMSNDNSADSRAAVRDSFQQMMKDATSVVPSPYLPFPVDSLFGWDKLTEGVIKSLAKDPLGPDADKIRNALDNAAGPGHLGEFERNMCRQRVPVLDNIKQKMGQASGIPSPIILDLDGDGVETAGVKDEAYFDHAGDGFAERTGWVGKDDGLLVRDLDGNGEIDAGAELFGSETMLENGSKAANGFAALAELDSNLDGRVDAQDSGFLSLKVWKDLDGNGLTDDGELLSLDVAGVQSINVGYAVSSLVDANGNAHRQVGSFTTTSGVTRTATDVWFQTDSTYTIATEWLEVTEDIAVLPNATGYGKVYDLHQAMMRDASGQLQALVTQFTQTDNAAERNGLLTQIIYRWTGVQDTDPASRSAMYYGNAIGDARKLEALEQFMGEEWYGVWCWGTKDPNPHGQAAPVLLQGWNELVELVNGQLMAQSRLKPLFEQVTYLWDDASQSFQGDLGSVADLLAAEIATDRPAALDELVEFVRALKGMGALDGLDTAGFQEALAPLGQDVVGIFNTAWAGLVATNGNDTLSGSGSGNYYVRGLGGDDTLTTCH